jgi:hypothetical protein
MHLRQFVLPSSAISALMADDAGCRGHRPARTWTLSRRGARCGFAHHPRLRDTSTTTTPGGQASRDDGAVPSSAPGQPDALSSASAMATRSMSVPALRGHRDARPHARARDYAVADRAREPALLFTGGFLASGRPDRPAWRTMVSGRRCPPHSTKLPQHHDYVGAPTHGAGSLSKSISSTPSTLATSGARCPVDEVEAFVDALLAGQPAFPRYFARMLVEPGGPSTAPCPGRGCCAWTACGNSGRGPSAHRPARRPTPWPTCPAHLHPAGDRSGSGSDGRRLRPTAGAGLGAEDWDDAVRQAL